MKTTIEDAIKRDDEHFLSKHAEYIKYGKEKRDVNILLLGDSLTRRWEDYPNIFSQYFDKNRTANFGIGADCIENLRWRIQDGELKGINPELVILLIGTNNLPLNSDNEIYQEILNIAEMIQERLPESRLLILGLLPRDPDENGNIFTPRIIKINQKLAQICQTSSIIFKDFSEHFIEDEKTVNRELMPDGLHMGEKGYHKFGNLIRPLIDSLI